jgi:hypothetical protein
VPLLPLVEPVEESKMPEAITEPEVVLGGDGQPLDPARAMETIRTQRVENAELRKERNWLRDSLKAVASGRPLTADQQAAVDYATPTAQQADLAAVAAVLGADASDPASVVEAAKQSRLSAELYGIMVEAGAEPKLTRAILNDAHALVDVDLSAADVHEQLSSIVAEAVADHPNLKVRPNVPQVSSFPIGANSNGSPALPISREALQYMSPEAIGKARAAGLLEHLNVGADR